MVTFLYLLNCPIDRKEHMVENHVLIWFTFPLCLCPSHLNFGNFFAQHILDPSELFAPCPQFWTRKFTLHWFPFDLRRPSILSRVVFNSSLAPRNSRFVLSNCSLSLWLDWALRSITVFSSSRAFNSSGEIDMNIKYLCQVLLISICKVIYKYQCLFLFEKWNCQENVFFDFLPSCLSLLVKLCRILICLIWLCHWKSIFNFGTNHFPYHLHHHPLRHRLLRPSSFCPFHRLRPCPSLKILKISI